MRRSGVAVLALVLAAGGLGATAVPAAAASTQATACATAWGSGPKSATATTSASLVGVRTGRHDCYDRMVLDIPGGGTSGLGYHVQYVDRLYQDGSGQYIPVAGGAVIEVRAGAPSYDPETGSPTYPGKVAQPLPGVDVTGYKTFRDTRFAGSFEGDTQIGLGVRARLPFRVTQLADRIVVDVAHTW
ncbi:AMIN-like domain-containing (lipo)protein [Streptomyces sp. NPDC004082]|jgi:hypothetical protein|uniref:AMIN-like domain-containing (lipo)protein n=1 Tax=unclassified Streptomyces TaxID=2593676 RepID=UPI0033B237F9